MPSRCIRALAEGLALALILGACNDSPPPPTPADPAGAGGGIRPAAEIDPVAIAAAVAELGFAVSERATLVAVAGERSTPLPAENVAELGLTLWSSDRSQVEVQYKNFCGGNEVITFSARTLVAHLENAGALAAYRAGRPDEAAAGFARAVVLDPDLDHSYTYLVSALAAAGEVDQAVAVLQLLLGRNPVHFYARVMLDPELAALREQPAIAALRSPTPGTATIDANDTSLVPGDVIVGVDPRRRHIAAVHSFWSSRNPCRFERILQIFDAATGELHTELPLVTREDAKPNTCDILEGVAVLPEARARVAERVDTANRVLRDLGFVREFKATAGTGRQKEVMSSGDRFMVEFPADRLTLWVDTFSTASVVRAGGAPARGPRPAPGHEPAEILVERAVLHDGDVVGAQHLPEVDAVAYEWYSMLGCGKKSSGIVVLPLSSSPKKVHGS